MATTNATHGPQSLTEIKTWTVKTSGGDFTSVQAALDYMADKWIGAVQTISVDDGDFSTAASIIMTHPQGSLIKLVGAHSYTKTLSSVQSVGSRTEKAAGYGNTYYRDYVLNLVDVDNIATGDYIIIRNTSGGFQSKVLEGCHYISNVDTGNKRITCRIFNFATLAASGDTTTTDAQIIKTRIICSDTTLPIMDVIGSGLNDIDKLVFTYGNDTWSATGGIGAIYVRGCSSVIMNNDVGICNGADANLKLSGCSYLKAGKICCSSGSYFGIYVAGASYALLGGGTATTYPVANGCRNSGLEIEEASSCRSLFFTSVGNGIGAVSGGGVVEISSCTLLCNNSVGVKSLYNGWINTGTPTALLGNLVDAQAISAGVVNSVTYTATRTGGATTSGNKILTMTNTEYLQAGMKVSGTGVGAAAVISSIDSSTQITVSVNSTATNTGLTFTFTPIYNLAVNTLSTATGAIILQ